MRLHLSSNICVRFVIAQWYVVTEGRILPFRLQLISIYLFWQKNCLLKALFILIEDKYCLLPNPHPLLNEIISNEEVIKIVSERKL